MIPELWDLLGGSALIALGGERTIGMGTKPDGSVLPYAGVKTRGDSARRSFEEASGPDTDQCLFAPDVRHTIRTRKPATSHFAVAPFL
jgi:hypothetical protein